MKGYIPTLDGWRAIAILGVILHHVTVSFVYPDGPFPNARALGISRALGDWGVEIFFAISGFLICTRLLQEREQTGEIGLKSFYLRRAFRILPPYFLYLAVLGVIAFVGLAQVEAKEWWGCALFVRNYLTAPTPPFTGWYTGHFWSLSVEEHFYLFWPLLLVICGNKRARIVVVVLALIIMLWRTLDERLELVQIGHITHRTDTRIDGLLWGCWAALLLAVPAYKSWITQWFSVWIWLGVSGLLVVMSRYSHTVEMAAKPFFLPWLLLGTILHPTTLFSRVLELGPVRWIGKVSYSLYLWQQLFLMGSMKVTRPFPMGWLQELPLNVMAAFACAMASYYIVERPVLRLGQRITARLVPHAKPAGVAAPAPRM